MRGPRAQADRDLYKAEMIKTMTNYPHLRIVEVIHFRMINDYLASLLTFNQASVEDLLLFEDGEKRSVKGIITKEGNRLTRFCALRFPINDNIDIIKEMK